MVRRIMHSLSVIARRPLRMWLPIAAVAALLAFAVPVHATTARRADAVKPTIVLVHGAFADGSSWSPVAMRLQKLGYKVLVPANPLISVAYDAAYLRAILTKISGPVILVGHSYGGVVI